MTFRCRCFARGVAQEGLLRFIREAWDLRGREVRHRPGAPPMPTPIFPCLLVEISRPRPKPARSSSAAFQSSRRARSRRTSAALSSSPPRAPASPSCSPQVRRSVLTGLVLPNPPHPCSAAARLHEAEPSLCRVPAPQARGAARSSSGPAPRGWSASGSSPPTSRGGQSSTREARSRRLISPAASFARSPRECHERGARSVGLHMACRDDRSCALPFSPQASAGRSPAASAA